jgi:predicted metal-dependent phosphotriesterase family hydrolase
MTKSPPPAVPRPVMAVLGPLPHENLGLTDAHNHVWISPIPGVDPSSPVLDQFDLIQQELVEYRLAGGVSLLDCQPGGCGRDGNRLARLAQASGVNLVACTGFHRKKYYPPDYWLWSASADKAAEYFISELESGLSETIASSIPVRAGFIKIALEARWEEAPQAALEGAAIAAVQTRSLVEIHTEKGGLAEDACRYFSDLGVLPSQLVLCHMDKRPDASLHAELARFGALLEYDTFFRPKYDPSQNLWPLLEKMVQAGCANNVALATDLAESAMYSAIGGGPGLKALPTLIKSQLTERGFPASAIRQMLGENIARRLAGLP